MTDRTKYLMTKYGITQAEYDILLKAQEGGCAIKGCEIGRTKTGILCVDHIHQKGFKNMPPHEKKRYIRGIVCFMHNTGFKSFEKTVDGKRNRDSLNGTYEYFQKYPLKGEFTE